MTTQRLLAAGLGLLLALATTAAVSAAQSPPAASLATHIDPVVESMMAEYRIPGVALALVVDGKLAFERGYGVADLTTRQPVTPERTRFRIGSITKAVTGLALLQLVDRGEVSLDDRVSDHLPEEFAAIDRFGEPVRVRHLLSHSGGFDQTGLGRRAERPEARPSLETFLRRRLVPVRPPGDVGVYDTYGITLAGYLVATVSGRSYADYVASEVFAPLGMSHSSVETPHMAELATGYGIDEETDAPTVQAYEHYVTLPASSIDATAHDMAQLMLALLGDGSVPAGRVLSVATTRRLQREPLLAYGPDLEAYAWAFWVDRRGGHRVLHHGGVMAGYSSELYLVPEVGLGLFVAYNRDPETGPDPRLRERLVDLLHDELLPPLPTAEAEAEANPTMRTERFAGVYANTLGCFSCVDEDGAWEVGTLTVEAADPGRIRLLGIAWDAVDDSGFRASTTGQLIRFVSDAEGHVRYLVSGPRSYARLDERTFAEIAHATGASPRATTPLMAMAHRDAERWDAAFEAYADLSRRHADNGRFAYYEGFAALHRGDGASALDALRRAQDAGQWRPWSQYYIASSHAVLGRYDLALDALEEAVEMRFGDPGLLRTDPWWDPLREDPRFVALMDRLGAP